MRILKAVLIGILSFSMTACSSSQVITSIQVTADLIAVSAPVVAATGNPVAAAYLTSAASATNCVLTAAEAAGATNATIAAAFGTCFISVVVPALPPGTPQEVIAIITAVNASIGLLVQQYGPKVAASRVKLGPVKLTHTDHSRIGKMHAELDHAVVVLHAAKS